MLLSLAYKIKILFSLTSIASYRVLTIIGWLEVQEVVTGEPWVSSLGGAIVHLGMNSENPMELVVKFYCPITLLFNITGNSFSFNTACQTM